MDEEDEYEEEGLDDDEARLVLGVIYCWPFGLPSGWVDEPPFVGVESW